MVTPEANSLIQMIGIANFLKTLFIVSDVTLTDKFDVISNSSAWGYSDSLSIPGRPGHRTASSEVERCQ